MNNITYLFGLPFYIDKIDPESYEKKKILSQIEENFKISKVRNNWNSNSFIKTDIHQVLNDEENKKFNKIYYYGLVEKYKEIINNFFKKINLKNNFKYKFNIVNYTCINHNSFMAPHIHVDCSFSMVHYISFDKKQHIPTIFLTPYYFSNLLPNKEKLRSVFDNSSETNSWLSKEWVFNTNEDDVVIFPSVLEHCVRNMDSEKFRITISVNIEIERDYEIRNK